LDDTQAIIQLKRGDINGLEALVERYQVRAVRAAALITQDRALAEDIVQTAFIRVYKRIDQFDDSRPFAPWFMRIVTNDAVKAVQRGKRHLSLDAPISVAEDDVTFADFLEDTLPLPEAVLEDDEYKAQIRTALLELPPEQRQAVVQRYFLDMSEKEMAEVTGVPAGTVKWRLSAARKVLRVILPRITAVMLIGITGVFYGGGL